MLRVYSYFLGILYFHSDVDIRIFAISDLNDGQTRDEIWIRRSDVSDFRFDGIPDVLRRNEAI